MPKQNAGVNELSDSIILIHGWEMIASRKGIEYKKGYFSLS
jgi:hypothetical protein